MEMTSKATLQEHQTALCELLQAFDEVCKKHQIRYMLFAGTALGAVRHQGFIPWDDDLDVVMLRSEYERFMAVAPGELDSNRYYLQAEDSAHWPMFFSKLRLNGTTCLERYIPKDPLAHQGVYIDIFPCDNLSDNPAVRGIQFLASKMVIAKALDRRGYLTDSFLKRGFMLLCRTLPMEPFKHFAQQRGHENTTHVHTFFGGASRYKNNVFPREWIKEQILLPFEGETFPVSAHYDAMLTKMYGEYRIPLPEDMRECKVHAEFVDLNRSYTEYLQQQETMQFKAYSKSIR